MTTEKTASELGEQLPRLDSNQQPFGSQSRPPWTTTEHHDQREHGHTPPPAPADSHAYSDTDRTLIHMLAPPSDLADEIERQVDALAAMSMDGPRVERWRQRVETHTRLRDLYDQVCRQPMSRALLIILIDAMNYRQDAAERARRCLAEEQQ